MAEIIRQHWPTVEFMDEMKESARDISRGRCPIFLKREEELLNSDAVGRQVGSSGVYDVSEISLSRHRVPGSLVRNDKNNAREGKGTGRKGQREANCAELRETAGEIDNHQQVEFGNEGGDE